MWGKRLVSTRSYWQVSLIDWLTNWLINDGWMDWWQAGTVKVIINAKSMISVGNCILHITDIPPSSETENTSAPWQFLTCFKYHVRFLMDYCSHVWNDAFVPFQVWYCVQEKASQIKNSHTHYIPWSTETKSYHSGATMALLILRVSLFHTATFSSLWTPFFSRQLCPPSYTLTAINHQTQYFFSYMSNV